jgi:DNA polymerase-3 subunit alpha
VKQTFCESNVKKAKEVLDKMKPKFVEQAAAKGHDAVIQRKYGKIGKLLPVMLLINHIHLLCLDCQTAYLKRIIQQNIWPALQ